MLNEQTILVTGGAGFIGSHIVKELLEQGVKKVIVLDNLSTGKYSNIESFQKKYLNFEFILGDIRNIQFVKEACSGCTAVCHLAAVVSVKDSIDNPLECHSINETGFFNILTVCRDLGIKRVVYASSAAVYGNTFIYPLKEQHIGSCVSPYGTSKFTNETHANIFTNCYQLECIGLRYFNVFGPRQDPSGSYAAVVPKFIELMKRGQAPTIFGNGKQTRDFVYISNIVHANILALTTKNEKAYGEVFNIGTGTEINLISLINHINMILNISIEPFFSEGRKGDIEKSIPDISKAESILDYKVCCSFKEGIIKTIKSYSK